MADTQINLNGYNMKIKDNGDGTYSTTSAQVGLNRLVGNYSIAVASGAAVGTQYGTGVNIPTPLQASALYMVAIQNPNIGTSVSVAFNNAVKFGGSTTYYGTVTTVDVPNNTTKCYLVQGWLLGDAAAQISLTLDNASTAAGTVNVEVIAI